MKKKGLAVVLILLLTLAGCAPAPATSQQEESSSVSASAAPESKPQEERVGVFADVDAFWQTVDKEERVLKLTDFLLVNQLDGQYTLIRQDNAMKVDAFMLMDKINETMTLVECPDWWIVRDSINDCYHSDLDNSITFRNRTGERPVFKPQDFPHEMTYYIESGIWKKGYPSLTGTSCGYRVGGTHVVIGTVDRVEHEDTQMRLFFHVDSTLPGQGGDSVFPWIEYLYRSDTRQATLLLYGIRLAEPSQLDDWGSVPGVEKLRVQENEAINGTEVSFAVADGYWMTGEVIGGEETEPTDHLMLRVTPL